MAQPECGHCAMFEEDEVCKRVGDRIIYGIVTESSEFLSSDEEDEEDEESLRRGTVRILWHPNGPEVVEEEKKVILVDRSLMPGDVIRRLVSGKSSQKGYIQDLDVRCHIRIKGTDKYIYDVNAKDLLPVREFDFDDDVTLDPWYGKVETTNMQARVVFPDGAQCIAEEENLYDLDILSVDDSDIDLEVFYPGSVLVGERDTLSDVKWIKETKTHNNKMSSSRKVHVRVEESFVKSVHVNWICRGYNTSLDVSQLQQPNIVEKEELHRLKKLGKFHHCSVQLNDVLMYTIKEQDVLSEVVPGSDINSTLNQINSISHTTDLPSELISCGTIEDLSTNPSSEQACRGTVKGEVTECCKGNEKVDQTNDLNNTSVLSTMINGIDDDEEENDGMSTSIDSNEVSKVGEDDDGEYEDIPEQKDKRKRQQKNSAKGRRKKKKMMEFQTKFPKCEVGEKVPVVVYCTVSKATVMWQDGSVETNISSLELFPIHHLDEHEFFPGDFVVEAKDNSDKPNYYGAVVSCDHQARTCMVNWYRIENGSNVRTSDRPDEVSVYDIKDHPDYKFRPGDIVVAVGDPQKSDIGNHAVGQIASLDAQGGLIVRWPDETMSFCNPQELYLVCGDMSEYNSDSDYSDFSSDTGDSWETEEEEDYEDSENDEEPKKLLAPVRKEELEGLLDRATAAISKLDDIFRTLPQSIDSTQCYQEIIYIYKKCRELEKILKSSFYKDEEIVELIEEAKKQLRRSRTDKYNRRIEQLSKQLKEVSQDVDLNGMMRTISVCSEDETQDRRVVKPGLVEHMVLNNSTADMQNDTENKLTTDKVMTELDKDSENICDIKKSDEIVDLHKDGVNTESFNVDGAKVEDNSNTTGTRSDDRVPVSGIDIETKTLCLKICGHLQDRMKRILEEVVPRWMADGNILIGDQKTTSQMSVSDEVTSSPDISEDIQSQTESSDIQEVTSPMSPTSMSEMIDEITANRFIQGSEAPSCHNFYGQSHTPTNLKTFMTAVSKEMRLLQRCLPEGIVVRGYEDRMDLYSVMIIGPKKTPYEDAPFFFDIQLPNDYPKSPPVFHYISFCTDRLNPNLYDDGKVCVSLLGTWEGKDTETWTSNSSLLQVLVSIQGLILVDEPYYNEAGYEKHRGTQQGAENSKMYNEMAILKLVESLTNMIKNIPISFRTECIQHLMKCGPRMIERFIYWSTNPDSKCLEAETSLDNQNISMTSDGIKVNMLTNQKSAEVGVSNSLERDVGSSGTTCVDMATITGNKGAETTEFRVEFPLFPLSRGFCITMNKKLSTLKSVLSCLIESYNGST